MSRGQKIVLGVLGAVVCAVLGVMGTDHVTLVCSRGEKGLAPCHVERSSPFFGERRYPSTLAEVREQRRVSTGKGKAPPTWTVALVDRRGAESFFGSYDSESDAAAVAERVRAYVRDAAAAPFRVEGHRGPWPYLFLVAAAVSVAWTIAAVREPRGATREGTSPRASLSAAFRHVRWFVVVIAAAAIAQGVLMWHAHLTQGWLVFEAEARCIFDGGEMFPGASVSMSIDPGRHCVRVYNPDVAGNWEEQCFQVEVGQTTTVRCRPSARRP